MSQPAEYMPPVYGLKVILMGVPGSGKTHTVRTIIDAGFEVFAIVTEANAFNTILNTNGASDAYKSAIAPGGNFHWKYIKPAGATWKSMEKTAKLLTTYDLSSIQKLAPTDKAEHAQFMEVLATCANFIDDKDGKEYGPIDQLDPRKHVVVVDSLTGLNQMFLSHVVGTKPVKSLPEWGAAIDMELNFINHLTLGIPVHVVVMAHIVRETDEVLGGIKTMVNALGKKAPQEIGKNFTDIILSKREGTEYTWSMADLNVDTKATTVEPGGKYPPTFVPLFETWRSRVGVINQGVT